MHKISTFVEQEDALLGVLTVRESVEYALRLQYVFFSVFPLAEHIKRVCSRLFTVLTRLLSSSPSFSRKAVHDRVDRVLIALGLQGCSSQRIGTAISRGISGGMFNSSISCHGLF